MPYVQTRSWLSPVAPAPPSVCGRQEPPRRGSSHFCSSRLEHKLFPRNQIQVKYQLLKMSKVEDNVYVKRNQETSSQKATELLHVKCLRNLTMHCLKISLLSAVQGKLIERAPHTHNSFIVIVISY